MVDIPATGAIATPAAESAAPTVGSMKEFLTEGAEPAEPDEKPSDEAQDPPADAKSAGADEEASDDEDEGEDSESKGEEKQEKSKKPNRYQRMKQRAEASAAEAKTARQEAHKATVVANQWYAEATALRDLAQKVFKQHGIQLDPRDLEVYQARRKVQDKELQEAAHSDFANRESAAAQQAQRTELQHQFLEEADALAEQYPGLTRKQILNAYAGVLEAEEDIPMSEVAENLATALKKPARNAATKLQAAVNQSAPKTITGRTSTPKFKADTSGMKAHLKASGLL
jgi:hypothetical protein